MNSKPRRIAVAVMLGVALLAGIDRVRSEIVLFRLTQGASHSPDFPRPSLQERIAYARRANQFDRIWSARGQRDVTAELVPFLQDPDDYLRRRAARSLGLLESPAAVAPLEAALRSPRLRTNGPLGALEHTQLQLALGRIRSRGVHGTARVTAVAGSVGLSLSDLARLSQKINGPERSAHLSGTPGDLVIQEIVELLYMLAKRNEDISPVTARLTLTPGQQLTLQGAVLPPEQEIRLYLDYLSQRSVLNGDERVVEQRLLALGPQATELILQRLGEMWRHPEQYRQPRSYKLVFGLAQETRDPRVRPLLEQFRQSMNPRIRHYAELALQSIERRERERQELERLSASEPTP
jgi:HEAT repeat protein